MSIESYNDIDKLAQEMEVLCDKFLKPRSITYFQLRRVYKNNSSIILANHPNFFKEFLENGFIEPSLHVPIYAHQSSICYWDETLPEDHLSFLREAQGIYHGFTILSRRKTFYDCSSFAMSKFHPSPVAYYFYILKELQKFAELFPTIANHLIKKTPKKLLNPKNTSHSVACKNFFLPARSTRFVLGEDMNNYITTYEAYCMQLSQAGKSHKEIGSLLSMASSTVKTHLKRLKTRTGLTLQEISLKSLQTSNNSKIILSLQDDKKHPDINSKESNNKRRVVKLRNSSS